MEINFQVNKYKIFNSLVSLKYKDPKLENYYMKFSGETSKKMWDFCSLALLFWALFMSILEGILLSFEGVSKSRNLRSNFIFCCWNFVICLGLYIFSNMRGKKLSTNRIENYICTFILHFCFGNMNLSLMSILIAYFKSGLEITSLAFLFKMIVNFVISFFIFRGFQKTLLYISINLTYTFIFLLQLHITKTIIVYLVTELVFSIILLSFVYMSEYFTKAFYYSFKKLEQEKEYYMQTLKFFNISYFKSKNFEVTNTVKIEEILDGNVAVNNPSLNSPGRYSTNSQMSTLKKIESLFGNMVSLYSLPTEIESYLVEAQSKKNFKFKRLVEIVKILHEEKLVGKKEPELLDFTKIGIIKLKGSNKEDNYFQFFLKFKFPKNEESTKNTSSSSLPFFSSSSREPESDRKLNNNESKNNVKIEGIFLNITQTYLKKEIQTNSLILSKYIHDIKSPLFLLKQVIHNYKKINGSLSDQIQPLLEKGLPPVRRDLVIPSLFKNSKVTENLQNETISYRRGSSPTLSSPKKKITNTISTINEHSNYLKIISKNIFQIIESINDFTKKQNDGYYHPVSTKENPNHEVHREKVDIRKLIISCVNFYNISIKFNPSKNKIRLYADIEEKIPKFIISDKTTLKQVVMNLLSNSIKFTNTGEVKVVCKFKSKFVLEEKNFVEINVIDTGCGIDEENLPKLCQPFALTTSTKYGSGLGLSIVHDFLTSLNSKLSIYSVKGKGSVFSFELPIEYQEESPDLDESDSSSQTSRSAIAGDLFHDKLKMYCGRAKNENLLEWEKRMDNKRHSFEDENLNDSDLLSHKSDFTIPYDEPFDKKLIVESGVYDQLVLEALQEEGYESWDDVKLSQVEEKKRTFDRKLSSRTIKSDHLHVSRKENKAKTYVHSKFKNMPEINPSPPVRPNGSDSKLKRENLETVLEDLKNFKNRKSSREEVFTKMNILKILLIDDDPSYQAQLIHQIKGLSSDLKANFTVDVSFDPIEGLLNIYTALKAHNEYYDLILIDENMPFMKGSAFSRLYKTLLLYNGFYRVPFVSISSETIFADQNGGVSNIFDYALSKPSKKKDIKLVLENVIKSKTI